MVTPRAEALIRDSVLQIAHLTSDNTPVVAYLGRDDHPPLIYVMSDYWPSKNDRALALGQAATAEMTLGGDAAMKGVRFGVLWAHVVIPRVAIDFSDETGLSWRRLEDAELDPRETEALLGFVFDIDTGFEIDVVKVDRSQRSPSFGELHRYESWIVKEPLPGLILMRTIAETAPTKEYV